MGELDYEGHRIGFDEYGEGERPIVLVHGLLMNRRMFERLGPALAERGNRVICVDLLGHGGSDQPDDLRLYSMPLFAEQVLALLDHLEIERAVVGGTSLGANVGLELAVRHPDRVEALFVEMPVLDNALAAVAAIFAPVLLGLRVGRPAIELSSRLASLLPRTNFLLDIGLDWARRRPGPSIAVLEGLLLGETAPRGAAPPDRPARLRRRPSRRPPAPVQRLRDAGRRAARRAPGRGQLDPRVAAAAAAARRGAGRLPRRSLGGARRAGGRARRQRPQRRACGRIGPQDGQPQGGRERATPPGPAGTRVQPDQGREAPPDGRLRRRGPDRAARRHRGGRAGRLLGRSGGSGEAHINQSSGSTNGVEPDDRAGTTPAQAKTTNLKQAAKKAGCTLRLHLKDEGHDHIAPTAATPEYKTNPPTSGNHVEPPYQQADGAYSEMPGEIFIVHALEHGRMEIQYSPELPEEDQLALKGLYETMYGGTLLFPNDKMHYEVAATTWTNLLGCPEYKGDATLDAIRAFGKATWGKYGGEPVNGVRLKGPTPAEPAAVARGYWAEPVGREEARRRGGPAERRS